MTEQRSYFLIGGIFALMIAMGIGRFAYTPILPFMQNELAFSNRVAGYLATSNYAGYLLGALLAGILPLSKHKLFALRFSLIVSIVTTALMGLFQSYFLFYIVRFISGVASAFIFIFASSIVLDQLASKGRTSLSGLFYSGVGFGITLSSLMIPGLHRSFQWEGTWIGLAVVSGLLAFFVWILLVPAENRNKRKAIQQNHHQVPPPHWLSLLMIAYGLEGLGYIVTGTFIVSIAQSAFPSQATFVWLVVGLASIPSCIIWAVLAKRWGFVQSLIIAMIVQSVGIALPAFSMAPTSLMVSALLFGATFMGITTLVTALARQINPANSNKIIGYLTATYALGQMTGPSIAGILSSVTDNYDIALLGAAFAVFVGACLLFKGLKFENSRKEVGANAICKYKNYE